MADNLSQNQIDELLKKMQSGGKKVEKEKEEEGPKAKVKEYDFTTPKKFTKDQLKSLNNLYETYSRVVASYFTGILRDICEVAVVQVEEQRYNEFNNALPDATLVAMIDFKPAEHNYEETTFMLEFSPSFGYLVIERLMGAVGDVFIPDRDYTDIELAILRTVLERTTFYLKEAWNSYFVVNTALRSIETNGRMIQAFSPQDVVVIVTLEIVCGSFSCTANICMPAENLDVVIASFSNKYARTVKHQDAEREKVKKDLVLDYLKQSDLVVEAVLDQCEMSFGEILQLQEGDVIALNKKIDSNICVTVDGVPWYHARLGESKMKKAIKLVDSIAI